MVTTSLKDIANALALTTTVDAKVLRLCTDSRQLQAGDLFLALKGEHFDGHRFLAAAEQAGAVAAVVEDIDSSIELPQLQVADCYAALAAIGQMIRHRFNGPLVGITGSSGKTTVKEMLASILSLSGNTLATRGNLNNHIGVPLTLMDLSPDHDFAVVEMGASGPGEIAYLASVAEPTVVLVNNVMPAHLQGFGSLEGVAMAKGEIYQSLGANAKAVINQDQEFAEHWSSGLSESQIVRFSLEDRQADLFADELILDQAACYGFCLHSPVGDVQVQLQMQGKHNVANALAAASCAFACGISLEEIATGLNQVSSSAGRLHQRQHVSGAVIIDDSYNANPGSVQAAIDTLAECDGKKIFVLGDMGELGKKANSLHAEVGRYAQSKSLDALLCVGELSKAAAKNCDCGQHFESKASLLSRLETELGEGTTVLIKGSRSAAMETIVRDLMGEEKSNNKADTPC